MSRLGKYIKKCQICGSDDLSIILPLGHQPPVHAHLTKNDLNQEEIYFPLNLCDCSRCGLKQLDYVVDPKVIFYPEYPYFTGLTNALVNNFRQMAVAVIKRCHLTARDLVVDIGSNDGTLLRGFKDKKIQVLGVEPTDVAKVANKKGILTLQKFFNLKTAKEIVKKYGQAKIITAANVFAHIDDLYGLLRGIKYLLRDDGLFVSESQYLMDTVEKTEFDCIYHEHLRYYSLKPLMYAFKKAGFSMIDAERINVAGGSIRIYAVKGKKSPSKRIKKLIKEEERAGLYDKTALQKFSNKVHIAMRDLLAILINLKKQNKTIVGIGAPGRSNTMLNFAHIDTRFLDYACEKSGSPKIGLFTPGTHIPIMDEEMLIREQPDYGLLLSWHIGKELIKKLRERGFKGKFIVPLPTPKII